MDNLEKKVIALAVSFLGILFVLLGVSFAVFKIDVPTCFSGIMPFENGRVVATGGNQFVINYVAKMWSFEPANVVLPVGAETDIYLVAHDVTHGLHIADTNVNLMAVPGEVNYAEITFRRPGTYHVICHEYCGSNHQKMYGTIQVVPEEEFDESILLANAENIEETAQETSLDPQLLNTYQAKGCVACHPVGANVPNSIGPSLHGIFGHEVELNDGSIVKVDDDYLRESLLEPNKKIVKGYGPLMPKVPLTDDEVNQLIKFIKLLK